MIPYVAWNEYYSVGDPLLDAQNKQIIGIFSELHEAMRKGEDHAALKPIVDRLLQHMLAHFAHEEQFMKENGYPDWSQHVLSHHKIQQRTRDLQEHAHLDRLDFLKDWWMGHILDEDKKYMPCLHLLSSHRW